MVDIPTVNRRTALKGIGGLAVLGGGAGVLSSVPASAQLSSIGAGDQTFTDDDGHLHKVTVDPHLEINWDGFDDAVAKVMLVIEAQDLNGVWHPVYRMTPWLGDSHTSNNTGLVSTGPGMHGSLQFSSTLSDAIMSDDRYASGHDNAASPVEIANSFGLPDYSGVVADNGVSESTYLGGSSIGSAPTVADYPAIVNSYQCIDAGYYGAAMAASDFPAATDGADHSETFNLRYTVAFIRANLSYMKFVYNGGTAFSGSTDAEKIQAALDAARAAGDTFWKASDIDVGNSGVCLAGAVSKDYASLRTTVGTPAVLSAVASFTVDITNQQNTASGSGASNTAAK